MSSKQPFALTVVLLLAVACSSSSVSQADGGAPGSDAGMTADAGENNDGGPSNDAGTTSDAGVNDAGPSTDAGVNNDAGTGSDAGVDNDAGMSSDAGVDNDAGMSSDAGVDEDAGMSSDAGVSNDAGTGSDAGINNDAGTGSDAGINNDAGTSGDAGTSILGSCDPSDLSSTCIPPEPKDPAGCAKIAASRTVKTAPNDYNLNGDSNKSSANTLIPEAANDWMSDTSLIQSVLGTGPGCVELTTSGANNAFLIGQIKLGTQQAIKIDQGVTVYASRFVQAYGSNCQPVIVAANGTGTANGNNDGQCGGLFMVTGDRAELSGPGTVDGQGGEPMLGLPANSLGASFSWWNASDDLRPVGAAPNPVLIRVDNGSNFVLHNLHLYNSPRYHVLVNSNVFVVWGLDIRTPTNHKSSAGQTLTNYISRNTDGVDPGGANGITERGYVVYNTVSTGDDMVAIKGDALGGARDLVVAHNHFGTGHGLSIGSSTITGVENVHIYDISILGSLFIDSDTPTSDLNGIRIKSYVGNGGYVDQVLYEDICVNGLPHPIFVTANYTGNTTVYTGAGPDGGVIEPTYPLFTNVTIDNFHSINTTTLHSDSAPSNVQLAGSASGPDSTMTLDRVQIDVAGGKAPTYSGSNAVITVGTDGTNVPVPGGTPKTVTFTNDPCTGAVYWPTAPIP